MQATWLSNADTRKQSSLDEKRPPRIEKDADRLGETSGKIFGVLRY
jgi:hypothetical protein